MMLIQVTCPHCGARYQFERSLIPQAGYDAQCANCSGIFHVAPDASGHKPPIALPSMSMIDTWLAPPALAPKSARDAAAPVELTPRAGHGAGGEVRDVTPRGKSAPGSVSPRAGGQAPATSVAPGEAVALQFSIACPSCETVYAFAVNDLPAAGIEAPCSQCEAAYRVTRIGDPTAANDGPMATEIDAEAEAAAEALRPIEPTVLDETKSEAVGEALASDIPIAEGDRLRSLEEDDDEVTTPSGSVLAAMARATVKGGQVRHEVPDEGAYDDRDDDNRRRRAGDRRPKTEDRPPTTADREPTTDEEPPTTDDRDDSAGRDDSEDVTGPLERVGLAAATAASDDDEPALIDAPTVVEARPGSRKSTLQVKVPLAASERSRAGAANWGPPDPQTTMRSRVRASKGTRERPKKHRPPFDDDDVQRLRRDAGGLVPDPREFDDDDGFLARLGLLRGERRVVIIWVSAVVLALTIIFAALPLLTGKSVLQVLSLRSGDPRLRELLDNARTALLTDTDVGYRDTLKLANDVLDADPSSSEARALYGIAAVFRGVDLRAAAQNMVTEGEVVQSSQMLAAASAELAHARRVLSRKNDESAELAFTAGIYYALDEDQRDHARDAFVRGLRGSHVDGSSPVPTAFAAYLQATLRNLDGDAAGARASLERAVELEPRWQRPRFDLARLEAVRGETGRARVLLAQVIAAGENHTKARELLLALPEPPAQPGPSETTPRVTVRTEQPKRPSPAPRAAKPEHTPKPESAKPDDGKVPAAEQGTTSPDQSAKPTDDGATKPDATANPDVQTPPDTPAIIRGEQPPFQPQADPKAPDAN